MSAASGEKLKLACLTVLGSGYAPFASGSWGSLVSAILFAGVWWLAGTLATGRWMLESIVLAGILLAMALSVRWGVWAITKFGRSDPKQFVLDEFAGQWMALLAMPLWFPSAMTFEAWLAFAGVVGGQFFLFRVFDVWKPPPARQLESLPAGWGILCDDLMAGVYANLVGQLLWRFTPLKTWLGLSGIV